MFRNLNKLVINNSNKSLLTNVVNRHTFLTTSKQQFNRNNNNNNSNNNSNSNNWLKNSILIVSGVAFTALTIGVVSAEDEAKVSPQTWRERIINNYQNRIREYSTPEKIFQCFASVKKNGESFMTVEDFIRAILPHQFKAGSNTSVKSKPLNIKDIPYSFKIADVDGDGLISFGEFMFFSTLLSIPESSVPIAFKIMDVNGDGSIDANEFNSILKILSNQSPFAKNTIATAPNTKISSQGFNSHLFGKKGDKRLTLEQFQKFLSQLRRDVLQLEFNFYDPSGKGQISQRDFGLLLISYCKLGQLEQHSKALSSLPNTIDDKNKGISFEQFVSFNTLLDKLHDVELSMDLYKGINQPFTKSQFKYVSKIICNIDPQPEVVNTVYQVFDTDKNGDLAKDEFVEVMERRKYRGLQNDRDTGIFAKFKKVIKVLTSQD
ncbi:hypothetical protein ACTFIV_009292 [Dictyostelium citrinum]